MITTASGLYEAFYTRRIVMQKLQYKLQSLQMNLIYLFCTIVNGKINSRSRMTKLTKILSLIATCLIQSAYAANVYYVTPEADGTGGGTSWSDATTLAGANGKVAVGDTIRMKSGTYTMTAGVTISKAITVEGGYKGEINDDPTDDLVLADNPETVLDGVYNRWVF